jgi:site-specific DNA recombinase
MPKNNRKRVWNLYRVSTKSQVNKNEDIPLQENACRKFIREHKDWELCNELYERGISGWKNKTDDRDELIKIKDAAENGEFDVLVVWMFDRLGRREDESPLVVQFLVEHGIEVWSVAEGQAKLEQHSDLLINYIRFWQSSGESKKTSIRVKEVMSQMNEHGDYCGGKPPYGYKIIETDIPHPKKDKFIKKLVIDPEEEAIVKLIFDLTLNKGYGGARIAKYLNQNGYTNRGNIWRHNSINRMLQNPIYMGRKRYNLINDDKRINPHESWKLQPKNDDLVIISEDVFFKTQKLISDRTANKNENINAPTASNLLLSGIVRCGYCGCKLKTDYTIKKYKRKSDGVITTTYQTRYRCHHARNVPNHGKSNYGSKMYEEQVEKIVIDVISKLNLDSFAEEANKYKMENINEKIIHLNKLKEQMQLKYRQLDKLNDEVAKSLLGESDFTPKILNASIEKTENDITDLREKISLTEADLNGAKVEMSDIEHLKTEFHDWETKYKNADLDSKKMMLSRILKDVVFKDKDISISFKLTIENSIDKPSKFVEHNQHHTDSNSVTNTLQELLKKHLVNQGLRHIEFVIERSIA